MQTEFPHLHLLTRLNDAQLEDLWRLYQCEWWTCGRRLEDVRRVVRNSDLIFAFCDSEARLAGFARVLTDFVYKALVFDVIVERAHRNQGLGRALLDAIISHPALASVEHIELYCLPELVRFYEPFGFTADLAGLRFMRKTRQPV